MSLVGKRRGKRRVRNMRVNRASDGRAVHELTVKAMLHGAFDASYT